MVSLTHATVVNGVDNPNRQVSSNAWNEGHILTGTANTLLTFNGAGASTELDAAAARTFLGLGSLATQSGTVSGSNTGDQTITLTGDVTGSGTGSFVATIPAGTVTLAKMANVATGVFLGRITAGSGVPEQFSGSSATSLLDLVVSGGAKGLMLGADKAKLDAITGTNTGDQTTITGNAGTATKLLTARTINGVAFDGSSNITINAVDSTARLASSAVSAYGLTLIDDADAATARTTLGLGTLATQSGSFSGTSSGTNTGDQTTVTGNAGTATTLQNARTIAISGKATGTATSFNGSANISIPITAMTVTLTTDVTGVLPAANGGEAWTYVRLASDETTTLVTFTDLTGMTFTPAANGDYEVEFCLMCYTATTTVGPMPQVSWGTGYSYGVCDMYIPTAATTESVVHAGITASAGTATAAAGGLPVANVAFGHRGFATFRAGASPTALKLQLASETAGTTVAAKAGSWMKYRRLA